MEQKPLRIGLVVGEASGANLALGMVQEILKLYPNAIIEGIGSEELIELGMHSLFDMNELSVMGLVEVLKQLPRLLKVRKSIISHFLNNPPDVFIGVDAPDFNLAVETKLKEAGVPTIHYVSPTVWAWREKRIHKIGKATNLVLGVFPFEKQIYDKYGLAYKFVGHTMADNIAIDVDREKAKQDLNLDDSNYIAILPGSRAREIESLLSIFLETFSILRIDNPDLKAIIPAVNTQREEQIHELIANFQLSEEATSSLKNSYNKQALIDACVVTRKVAREVMIASDLVLLASGTAALEAMLCKRPMVVAYKMSAITYMMMKRMYKPKYFSLPNILADELLVPELLQDDVNPQNLAKQLQNVWQVNYDDNQIVLDKFVAIHKTLKCNADKQAAIALLELAKAK